MIMKQKKYFIALLAAMLLAVPAMAHPGDVVNIYRWLLTNFSVCLVYLTLTVTTADLVPAL